MEYGKHIARNTAWLTLAMVLNKTIAFISFAVIARLIGPQVTGVYFYAVSVTSVFVVLADLGMAPVIIREIASGGDQGQRFLSAALRLKLLFAPIAIFSALGFGIFTHANSLTFLCIVIACAVMTADTVHLILYAGLRGKQNLKPEALGMLIGQVLTSAIAISSAYAGYGAPGLVLALLVGSVWNVTWAFVYTQNMQFQFPIPHPADYKKLCREAIPFALAGIAVKIYSYTDSLLLKAFQGIESVGMYAVAYKMTYAFQFLPLTFSAALYPSLSEAWGKKDHARLQHTFLEATRLTAAFGFAIAAGLSAFAPRLILEVYGSAFLGSVAPFEILPWVLLPIFMDFPIGSLLNATGRAKQKTMAMIGTMFINVILNVILVPRFGPFGAAWAGVFSFWSLYGIGLILTRQDVGGFSPCVKILLRAIIASIGMWICIRYIAIFIPLIPALIFGSAASVACAFLTRLIRFEDIFFILRLHKTDADIKEEVIHEDV